jgi:hypothetical protein
LRNKGQDPDHYHGYTPLEQLDIGLVTNVVNNHMPSVLLGVTKVSIERWFRMCKQTKDRDILPEIDQRIESIAKLSPTEFSRKPRSIKLFRHWKALEFRTFLVYYGPIIMKDILTDDAFDHFMYFSCAIRILFNRSSDINYANDLLSGFVEINLLLLIFN